MAGVGIGIASVIAPDYIAEIAPAVMPRAAAVSSVGASASGVVSFDSFVSLVSSAM